MARSRSPSIASGEAASLPSHHYPDAPAGRLPAHAVPSRAGKNPGDDPAVRGRIEKIAHRSAGEILESIRELGELGLVSKVAAEVHIVDLPMIFKLYALNEEEVFFGFYPVVERDVEIDGKPLATFDAVGKDTVLFHHSVSDDDRATGSQYVEQARHWFDSLWGHSGRSATCGY